MKICLSILAVLTLAIKLSAAGTNSSAPLKIGANDAAKHYDQEMIVTGKVAQVTVRPTIVFLNLDQPYPDSPFTLVVFPGATNNQFGDLKALDGKNVEAKGIIKNYHDKPEIVLDNTNQLKVIATVESTNAAVVK
jgi:DNA/RNA endonuclease YhcR with UshA esterase domain